MKTTTPNTLPIGVIVDNSAGVYSADEWNRALADTLRDFTGDEPAEKFLAEIAETDDEWQHEITDELHDALSEFAPPHCYVGYSDCEPGVSGCWPSVESAREDCGFVSSRDQDYPDDDYRGEWLHVSDHGNATLYVRDEHGDHEIWSVV